MGNNSYVFVRTHHSQEAIVELDNQASGVPYAIRVEGSIKCISCEAFAEDSLLCEDCHAALRALRAGPHTEILQRFLTLLIDKPALLTFLEAITDEAIAEYFLARISRPDQH